MTAPLSHHLQAIRRQISNFEESMSTEYICAMQSLVAKSASVAPWTVNLAEKVLRWVRAHLHRMFEHRRTLARMRRPRYGVQAVRLIAFQLGCRGWYTYIRSCTYGMQVHVESETVPRS